MTQSMEAKIMKCHVLLWSFGKILPEDQDRDEDILLSEQVKKLIYSVNESAHFYLTWAKLIFHSPVFHQFHTRKIYTLHLHMI